jgi:hypothetical protein
LHHIGHQDLEFLHLLFDLSGLVGWLLLELDGCVVRGDIVVTVTVVVRCGVGGWTSITVANSTSTSSKNTLAQ